jgi:hypothetical protein
MAAFSAAMRERYSARRDAGYYFPKIAENPWERPLVPLSRRSGNMGFDPASLAMELDPVELVAGRFDAVENGFAAQWSRAACQITKNWILRI